MMIETGYGAGKSAALLIERWRRLAQEYRDEADRLEGEEASQTIEAVAVLIEVLRAWAQARENCAMELQQEIGA
jgi:hypothetical protein